MIILTAEEADALNAGDGLLWVDGTYQGIVTALWPRGLIDGTFALPEVVLTDPAHQRWYSFLSVLPTRAVEDSEWAS